MTEQVRAGTDLAGTRRAVSTAKRVVVKIGSSSLTSVAGGLDHAHLRALTAALAAHRAAGHEVILVSSGAIAAGLEPMGIGRRPKDLATQQAAAGVGQSLLMAAYTHALAAHGVVPGQVLLTADDLIRRSHYRNAQRAVDRLLALGIMPIVNENDTVATREIRFGDNDRLAALVAHLAHADALVLLSDVDALHTAPPGTPGAAHVPFVAGPEDLAAVGIGGVGEAGVGTGGMLTKVQAATMAADSGIPTVLTSAPQVGAALAGADLGTYFGVTHRRRQTRLLWLAHLAETHGSVHVDAGAARALLRRGTSLLAAGVTAVSGEFEAGDPVDVRDPAGDLIARGMVNFASHELPGMFGMSIDALGDRFGGDYRKEVIHRNDLVLTDAVF
ncbi:glutamate 5-kinase [Brevibacterium sp. CS2]|uniref:glutamate 5-kinase n=1 Tax=Brevibacterium sp. CS2 TaxID=2575923 RepID=UPI0010C7CA26|nr:glutamate 5-kinase [Brevibacterium sp. CS2]QCP05527.1 glutamate 5-kinase [Brevibacterium sp. CS2]